MKKIMLLGLLVMLGISFARIDPPPGPEFGNYVQTCCQLGMAYSFGTNVYMMPGYSVWNGNDCVAPSVYNPMDIYYLMWGDDDGGVDDYFWDMVETCYFEGQASSECLTAKSQFNSFAKSARGTTSMAYMGYLLAARQAISADRLHGCGTGAGTVSGNLRTAMQGYRECIQNNCERR